MFIHRNKALSRTDYGKIGGWASILLNLFLFLLKLAMGIISGSIGLLADAFHTLSDLATSVVVLISFRISGKPSDSEHPFGHGRAELVSAVIMATLLAATALELFKISVERLLQPVPFTAPWWIIAVLVLTILLKEGLALFSGYLARKIYSPTLKADAWHHHLDAVSTLFVVATFLFAHYHLPNMDGPAGIVISLIILYSAYGIAREPIDQLLGSAPGDRLLSRIEEIALSFPEVLGVHDIIVHRYGETTIISLHIEVDENLSLRKAHAITEKVDQAIRREMGAYVVVHADPVMERTGEYQSVERLLREFCEKQSGCDSFHDLRMESDEEKIRLSFDLVSNHQETHVDDGELMRQCEGFLRQKMGNVGDIRIKVEPKFSITRKSRHNW